ncbi:MAG: hypothetical protein QY319_05020 [Candidatus Kapaibacterium sp.]|nr:MAG: hypothetical protein QY319_05020 [Candidatus Kapabacteria bacterium]
MSQLSLSSFTDQEILFLAGKHHQFQVSRGLTQDLGEVDFDQSRYFVSGFEKIVALYGFDGRVVGMYQIDCDDFCDVEV